MHVFFGFLNLDLVVNKMHGDLQDWLVQLSGKTFPKLFDVDDKVCIFGPVF